MSDSKAWDLEGRCYDCGRKACECDEPTQVAKFDMLEDMFKRQEEFMRMLEQDDKLVQWPIDLSTKQGQRIIKEMMHNMTEELFEASFTLKNRMHRLTDDRSFDDDHYEEELIDTLSYLLEILIMSGRGPHRVYEAYCKKNAIVKERFKKGY